MQAEEEGCKESLSMAAGRKYVFHIAYKTDSYKILRKAAILKTSANNLGLTKARHLISTLSGSLKAQLESHSADSSLQVEADDTFFGHLQSESIADQAAEVFTCCTACKHVTCAPTWTAASSLKWSAHATLGLTTSLS